MTTKTHIHRQPTVPCFGNDPATDYELLKRIRHDNLTSHDPRQFRFLIGYAAAVAFAILCGAAAFTLLN